mmetsp:Transcript_5532/g.8558  ORF Transcript_5532/g.8558 Transcript_5532/m.8558 type:complete len:386 (+) Transcript_5532:235-1392(+)
MRSCSPNKSRSSYYNKKFLNRKGTQKIQALVVVLLVILCDTLKAPMLFSAAWQKISCQSGWTNRKRLMLIQHGASYSKYREHGLRSKARERSQELRKRRELSSRGSFDREKAKVKKHRKRTPKEASLLTPKAAEVVAKSFQFKFHQRATRGSMFGCDEKVKEEYEAARKSLAKQNLKLFGFHIIHDFITPQEEKELLAHIESIKVWYPSEKNDGRVHITYGIEYSQPGYKVKSRTAMPLLFKKLGQKAMASALKIKDLNKYSCHQHSQRSPAPIDQLFLNKYTKEQTLGFHFDNRPSFQEIICGVSLNADTTLLLGATSGSSKNFSLPTIQAIEVPKNSLYVLSGMSRYDLRHAVRHHKTDIRYSLTFRSLTKDTRQKLDRVRKI